jgi:hypothetical protein
MDNRQLAIGNVPMGNRQSAMAMCRWGIGNGNVPMGNRESAICRWAIGSRQVALDYPITRLPDYPIEQLSIADYPMRIADCHCRFSIQFPIADFPAITRLPISDCRLAYLIANSGPAAARPGTVATARSA